MASLENVSREKIRIRKKKATSETVVDVIISVVLILFAIVVLYPLINTAAYSFSDGKDAIYGRIHLLPRVWSLESYKELLTNRISIRNGAVATIARTLIGAAIGVIANAFLAFILSRKKFIYNSALSLFWVITIYAQAGLIPVLCLYRRLHLTQSFWVYIVPGIISGIYVLVMRTYMKSIPDSLEEAAKLDGAGYIRIFWSIVMPNVKPAWLTIIIFSVQSLWNNSASTVIYSEAKKTLVYALQQIQAGGIARTGQAAAVTVIVMLVPIAIFILSQSRILETMASSGLKD